MIHFMNNLDEHTKDNIAMYIRNLNTTDLQVRDLTNYSQYIESDINKTLTQVIANDINSIDLLLTPYKNLLDIPWKIAILQENVENNLPHTHNDVIFLPKAFNNFEDQARLETLLHEKIHIYQRKYPIHTQLLFTTYWLTIPYSLRTYEKPNRSNPDINHIIYSYFSPETRAYVYDITQYHNAAKKITDSSVKQIISEDVPRNNNKSDIYHSLILDYNIKQTEHPNETMACLITDMVLKNVTHEPTISWMVKFMNV